MRVGSTTKPRTGSPRFVVSLVGLAFLLLVGPAAAAASAEETTAAAGTTVTTAEGTAEEAGTEAAAEQRGAELLAAVQDGERDCEDLVAADYEAIGEFTMGRMLGSPQAHESMDQLAITMMGTGGLERMHQAMGQRFAGCGQPAFPSGFAQMMSMMPGMGGSIGGPGGGLMMGGGSYGSVPSGPGGSASGRSYGFGPGSMMGSSFNSPDRDSDDGPTGWMAVAMLILILGAAGLAYFLIGRRPAPSGPAQVLARRLAAGEISVEEYESRLRLLEGR